VVRSGAAQVHDSALLSLEVNAVASFESPMKNRFASANTGGARLLAGIVIDTKLESGPDLPSDASADQV